MKYRIALFALLLVAFGCADNQTTEPETAGSTSKVEHTYSGSLSGTFKVTGAFPSLKEGEGVRAVLSNDRKRLDITAVQWTKKDQEARFFVLNLTSDAAFTEGQTFTLVNPSAQALATTGFDVTYPNYAPSQVFTATSTTVTLNVVKADQIKGTYSATMAKGSEQLAISNGQFDVKFN